VGWPAKGGEISMGMNRRRLVLLIVFAALAVLLLGCGGSRTYTVQAGDTLQSIALKNHTTTTDIVQLNKDRYPTLVNNSRVIRPGWQLQLPPDNNDVATGIESLLIEIARQASPPSTPQPSIPAAPNDKIKQVVQEIFDGINQERLNNGLSPLVTDPNLNSIAQTRSNDMITRNYFSHTDPDNGQVLFQVLLRQQGYTYLYAGENIAEIRNQGAFVPAGLTVYSRYSAQDLADQFVTGWINSPEHHDNIVNPHFRRTGIALGVSIDGTRVVATQVFSD
jgi:uncharacterized protein YkwD